MDTKQLDHTGNFHISIVVPFFNRQEHIAECIDSVLAQTYQDWDLILIDDGSSDNSWDLCSAYAAKDDRIKLYGLDSNQGVSAARNKGLSYAKGPYVMFIDSDDTVDSAYLEYNISLERENNADCVITCATCRKEWISTTPELENNYVYTTYDSIKKGLVQHFAIIPFNCVFAKLFKKELIDTLFDEKLTMSEDFLFSLMYLKNCKSLLMSEARLYYNKVNAANSICKNYIPGQFTMMAKVQEVMEGYFENNLTIELHERLFYATKECLEKAAEYYPKDNSSIKETMATISNNKYFQEYLKSVQPNGLSNRIWAYLMSHESTWIVSIVLLVKQYIKRN